MTRIISLILAYFFLDLALLGVFIPGLPTVPFLLLTAWFAARGSERLHSWLYAHPQLGKLLIDWEQHGAISMANKVMAFLLLTGSWVTMYYRLDDARLLLGVGIVFIIIIAFILSRPPPSLEK